MYNLLNRELGLDFRNGILWYLGSGYDFCFIRALLNKFLGPSSDFLFSLELLYIFIFVTCGVVIRITKSPPNMNIIREVCLQLEGDMEEKNTIEDIFGLHDVPEDRVEVKEEAKLEKQRLVDEKQ